MGEGIVTDGAVVHADARGASFRERPASVPSADAAKSTSASFAMVATSSRRSSPGMERRWSSGRKAEPGSLKFGSRTVLDSTLADGHALWVADVDGDGDDEVFAGHRGKDHRVSMYDLDRTSGKWTRTVLDRDIAAQDLRGGDLDGDGTPDVVAVGGATHNVVWYRFRRP